MRKFLKILTGVAVLALAGCVYPGYTYVRGGYQGGYYTGDAYYYDDGYYAPGYDYGGYGCCGWYGPSVNIGVGDYGDGHYHHGYRGDHDRGRSGHYRHGDRRGGSWDRRHH